MRTSASGSLADANRGENALPGFACGLETEVVLGFVTPDNEALVSCLGDPQHTDARAVAALEASHAQDPSPAVRKKAGWHTPGGTIYERTAPRAPR